MGLLDKIKADAKKSGQNKSKFIYFREGQKQRVRFLNDVDDGMEVVFHDSFDRGINIPCQEHFGRSCDFCDDENLRTRSQYVWSVYNYETKEVQLFMFAVNNCSPIPALMAMYETYGTLTDRDYVISVSGKQQNKTFSVVPMDKNKFRNEKAKPFSEKAILKMLDKAFPNENVDDDDDEDFEPKKTKKTKVATKRPSKKEDFDDDDDFEDEDDFEDSTDEVESDYESMSPKELYQLCKKRNLEVAPKKPAKYYINQLEEDDAAHEDWEDEDEDWEDEDDE